MTSSFVLTLQINTAPGIVYTYHMNASMNYAGLHTVYVAYDSFASTSFMQTAPIVDGDGGRVSGARSLLSAGTAFTLIFASLVGLFL